MPPWPPTPRRRPTAGFGTADHLVSLPGTDPHLAADLAAIRAHFGTVDVIENQNLATGLVRGAQLRAQDPNGPYGRPMLALVSGRYPAGAGEVAMTRQLAATFALHVGGPWQDAGRTLRVVGLVENPQNLLDNFALVAPGQLGSPTQVTVLFDERPPSRRRLRSFPTVRSGQPVGVPNGISPAVIVFAIAIVGLIFVGLVAVAGFTVLAQRRLRGLGMLSSLGATDRNVRLVMVANGAVVGVVGALVGAVLGLAALDRLRPAPGDQRPPPHRLDPPAVVAGRRRRWCWPSRRRPSPRVGRRAPSPGRPSSPRCPDGRRPPKDVHRSALPGAVPARRGSAAAGVLRRLGRQRRQGHPVPARRPRWPAPSACCCSLRSPSPSSGAVDAARPGRGPDRAARPGAVPRALRLGAWRRPASPSSSRCWSP